jgi:uncharacterized SAM-binding protein YcdF (DUF218 family)
MSTSWFFTNLVAAFLLPPLALVMLGLLGWRLSKRFRAAGKTLIVLAVVLLLVLSTGAGSRLLVAPLENRSLPVPDPAMADAQAIVILGGGRAFAAPEDAGRDQPGAQTLVRLRHGARLYRLTRLPVLVSGGAPDRGGESEALLMARTLREDFQVPVRWVEDTSENTAQNAAHAAKQLREAGIDRVLLVTDAMHMPRAIEIFSKTDLSVVRAPTHFMAHTALSAEELIPNPKFLRHSHYALHEWIGMFWYRLRY